MENKNPIEYHENTLPCSVIQDLMPIVCDHAGSKESEKIVETHIAFCEECKRVWGLLQRKDASASPSKDQQAEKQGFQKSLKKQKRKFGIWKAVAILCALIVLGVTVYVVSEPTTLNGLAQSSVPLSMFGNARLVSTKQGNIFLLFTPGEDFPYVSGIGGNLDTCRNDSLTRNTYLYRFSYNPLAPHPENRSTQNFGFIVILPSGECVFQLGYHYLNGKLMVTQNADPTYWKQSKDEKEVMTLLAMGANPCSFQESAPMDLYLTDDKDRLLLYQFGSEIPLCDAETQKIIDTYYQKGWWFNDDLLSCLYVGDGTDAEMQEELEKIQEYQLKLFEGQPLETRKG